ncbi:disease resistance protein RGA5-like [Phragmites australis]|uniref:disease resistance protein RGA5-like n=1 Tax=Phragmites australis TaxID=29695 RepID=UPI002D790866|nr:disease resistance protein RGA5-like [Phragmites australis]XP_062182232.1 disease resistance protein RGA5-like [Phragmites australis]
MDGNGIMASAVTGVMNSLLTKLAALLGEDYQMQKGMRREIAFLKDELSSMNSLLERLADTEALDPQTREWRNQVREMTYDIEDCVDEYMRQLRHEPQRPSGVMGFFLGYVQKVKELVTRHEIAEQIQELKARIVEANHRRKRYKLDSAVNSGRTSMVPVDRRLPALYAELGDLVGINGLINELIKLVDDREQMVKVVSIVGCGGLGKTTLANQVYRKIAKQFDCQAFVSLSQNPDMGMIFRSIVSQVKKDECDSTSSCDKEQLINELRDFLKDKRYFIVIDDIWSTQAWKIVKCALLENTCGSRIIVTTRIGTVAKLCSSPRHDLVYDLSMLSEDDSKSLFFRRIFGSEDKCPHQLKEVSIGIVRKCGGLPLAIITMASLLTTKSYARTEWVEVCNSIGSGLEKNWDVEEMNMILSLSYNHLPRHLKTCLLYLSMFPEDYVINRDYLVRRWVGEGFINLHGGRSLEDEGECYFNELINRSLIQPVDFQYDGRVYACRVHDMILDLIVCKAVEENFVTVLTDRKQMLVSQDKVHRLSLGHHGQENVIAYSMVPTHVRTLNIFRYSEQMPLSDFRALRVLDLDGNENLENSYLEDIGKLFHLRYLRIKASNITLPEQIGELRFLVILDLLNCPGLSELPASIVKLRHLKWLIAPPVNLPDGVGNMQALEFLSLIVVDYTTSITLLQELGSLTKLRTLGLDWRISALHRDRKTYADNFVSSLDILGRSNLQYLTLISPWSLDFLLDSWSPPPHLLQELGIKGWYLSNIPVWMASLANLSYLDIEVKMRQETLQILGDFPALQFLKLCSNPAGPVERCLVVSNNGFQCLKKFSFVGWVNLMFEERAMPMLETLEFQIIAHAVQTACGIGPPDLGICHLSALRNLVVNVHCEGARIEEVEALEAAIRIGTSMLPNHPKHALHRFGVAEMVTNDAGIEKQGHEEDKKHLSAPAWFFNMSGPRGGRETTLNPGLVLLEDV